MCCEADWKREVVQDHKYDFVNVREFHRTDFLTRLKYIWRYILLLKSFAVYGFDIFTASTLILSNHWTNVIQSKCGDDCAVQVQFSIAKWIFVGCIIFSFLLLGYESYKAKAVIASRDISYAFTNLLANDYYSFKNYDNFCLFCHIDNSTKKKDDFAFFIFFTFKDWKRLLLADGPRQSINALLLYSFAAAFGFQTSNIPAYWENSPVTAMLLFSMIATVLIFAGSLILLIAAAFLYVPLLCYIQGNLKEYVCHKVDKRIEELIKRKQRDRIRRAAALEQKLAKEGMRNPKGDTVKGMILQPTLPDVKFEEEELVGRMNRKTGKLAVGFVHLEGVYPGKPPVDNMGYDAYIQDSRSMNYNVPQDGFYQQDNYGSSFGLAAAAAPMGLSYPPVIASPPLPSSSFDQMYSIGGGPSVPRSRSQSSLHSSHGGPRGVLDSSHQRYLAPIQAFPVPQAAQPQRHYPSRMSLSAERRHGENASSPSNMSSYSRSSQPICDQSGNRTSGLAYDEIDDDQLPAYTSSSSHIPSSQAFRKA